MRLIPTAASCLALALCAAFAFADEVVLKNGRSLSGRIVKDDAARVTLETATGTLTIARAQIESVRQSVAPAPAAPPKTDAPRAATSKSSTAGKTATSDQPGEGKSPRERLADLDAIQIAPWVHEDASPCTELSPQTFKVVWSDGRVSMRNDRPKDDDRIAALYLLNDDGFGQAGAVRGVTQRYCWNRLYWHTDGSKWLFEAPGLVTFHRDERAAKAVSESVCKDSPSYLAASWSANQIQSAIRADRGAPATRERADLRRHSAAATGSQSSGELLARYFELTVDIKFATAPADKVRLAMKRRDVLRDLVAACGK